MLADTYLDMEHGTGLCSAIASYLSMQAPLSSGLQRWLGQGLWDESSDHLFADAHIVRRELVPLMTAQGMPFVKVTVI